MRKYTLSIIALCILLAEIVGFAYSTHQVTHDVETTLEQISPWINTHISFQYGTVSTDLFSQMISVTELSLAPKVYLPAMRIQKLSVQIIDPSRSLPDYLHLEATHLSLPERLLQHYRSQVPPDSPLEKWMTSGIKRMNLSATFQLYPKTHQLQAHFFWRVQKDEPESQMIRCQLPDHAPLRSLADLFSALPAAHCVAVSQPE